MVIHSVLLCFIVCCLWIFMIFLVLLFSVSFSLWVFVIHLCFIFIHVVFIEYLWLTTVLFWCSVYSFFSLLLLQIFIIDHCLILFESVFLVGFSDFFVFSVFIMNVVIYHCFILFAECFCCWYLWFIIVLCALYVCICLWFLMFLFMLYVCACYMLMQAEVLLTHMLQSCCNCCSCCCKQSNVCFYFFFVI